jgi:ABC-2 type transport system permease protein
LTWSCNFSADNGCGPETVTITWPMAGTVMAAVLVAVVVAAVWTMGARDVAVGAGVPPPEGV